MSGGGGSGSDGGGRDTAVSGAEAVATGGKTYSDRQISSRSFSDPSQSVGGTVDAGGQGRPHSEATISYTPTTRAVEGPTTPERDTFDEWGTIIDAPETKRATTTQMNVSQKGWEMPNKVSNYSDREIEKGYTDQGEKLDQVGAGKYMTKSEQYSTGLIEKDPTTGEDVQGRYRVNPNTGEFERADLSFGEHWANRPNAIKYSPTLSLLYAGGKNISEFFKNKGFKGYNEAGLVTGTSWKSGGTNGGNGGGGNGMSESQMMHAVSPHAPFIVSGTTAPSTSAAANWYNTLGGSGTNPTGFNLANEYAAAKAKVSQTLKTSSAVGQIAVGNSAFYNFLKDNSLNKGIL